MGEQDYGTFIIFDYISIISITDSFIIIIIIIREIISTLRICSRSYIQDHNLQDLYPPPRQPNGGEPFSLGNAQPTNSCVSLGAIQGLQFSSDCLCQRVTKDIVDDGWCLN